MWFSVNRRAGKVILHHNRIRPVLIREWSREMDGNAAAIWASRTTAPVRETLSDGVGRWFRAVAQPERQDIV
jgi:nuclear transport factor 2 (NTF2) superfamily protein